MSIINDVGKNMHRYLNDENVSVDVDLQKHWLQWISEHHPSTNGPSWKANGRAGK